MTKKKIPIILFVAAGLFLSGCGCWQEEMAAQPVSVKEPMNPCAAAAMAKSMQSYPIGGSGGSAILLEKMAPAEVVVNQPFDYRIKVTNLTDIALTNVMVKDCVPENLKIESSMPQANSIKGGDIHWMLGTLEPRASRTISVNAVAEGKGFVSSCAEVSYDSPICAKIGVVEPKLELAKFAPAEVLRCDRVPLGYVVTNTGDGVVCDIMVRDSLPKGLMTSEGESEIMFKLASLAPGKSHEFTKVVDATATGKYASQAIATSQNSGKAESKLTETTVREPSLAINESCPANLYIGRPVTYDITVTNKGDGPAKDTVIQANVPEGIKFGSATDGGRFSTASPGKVVWNVGTLEPNASRKVSMTLMGESPGSIQTTAMAEAHCADGVSTSCQTLLSGISAILLEVVDVSDPIELGQDETYIVTVTNQGSAPDTNIRIACLLSERMQYVNSSGPTKASVSGNQVVFADLPSLAPKAQAKWRVTVKALGIGDVRFKTTLTSTQLSETVDETEATMFYK